MAVLWIEITPSPSKAGIVIAVVAAVMSLQGEMRPWQTAAWFLLIAMFVGIEFKAIDKDRTDNQAAQARIRADERADFKSILKQGEDNLRAILAQQQKHFEKTVTILIDAQREEHKQFANLLRRQEALFARQEKLFGSLGGVLIPAHDETPPNICGAIPAEAVAVFFGNSVMWGTRFPFSLLRIGAISILTIDKDSRGISLTTDIKSADGKIVASIYRNEFTVNRNNILEMKRPDHSSLVVSDQYGRVVLNVRYLNPHAIKILGTIYYGPSQSFVIEEEQQIFRGLTMSSNCFGNLGTGIQVGN